MMILTIPMSQEPTARLSSITATSLRNSMKKISLSEGESGREDKIERTRLKNSIINLNSFLANLILVPSTTMKVFRKLNQVGTNLYKV